MDMTEDDAKALEAQQQAPDDDSLKQFLATMSDPVQRLADAPQSALSGEQAATLRLRPDVPAPAADWAAIAKSLGSKPVEAPKQEPLDWKGIADKLKSAQGLAGMQRTVENSFENSAQPGRYHALPDAGKELIAQAEAPVELAKARTSQEHAQAQADQERQKTAAGVAERDPNSDVSKRAVGAFKAFMGDAQLPPNIDSWSAADVKSFTSGEFLPLMKLKNVKDVAAEKASGAAKTLADEKASLKLQYRDDPDTQKQIDASPTVDSLKMLQTAVEGRKHQDKQIQEKEDSDARLQQKEMEAAKLKHELDITDHPMPTEQQQKFAQAVGLGSSIDQIEAGMKRLNTPGKRRAAALLMSEAAEGNPITTGFLTGLYSKFDPETVTAAQSFVSLQNNVGTQLASNFDGLGARPATVKNAILNLTNPNNTVDADKAIFADLRNTAAGLLDKQIEAARIGGVHLPAALQTKPKGAPYRGLTGEAPALDTNIPVQEPGQNHGKVVKETARVRVYEDGFREPK